MDDCSTDADTAADRVTMVQQQQQQQRALQLSVHLSASGEGAPERGGGRLPLPAAAAAAPQRSRHRGDSSSLRSSLRENLIPKTGGRARAATAAAAAAAPRKRRRIVQDADERQEEKDDDDDVNQGEDHKRTYRRSDADHGLLWQRGARVHIMGTRGPAAGAFGTIVGSAHGFIHVAWQADGAEKSTISPFRRSSLLLLSH